MARTGKIARLPLDIRQELNRRLADGESGKSLVAWLNSLPEVEEVMEEHFCSRPINEQNLTEWKQGGYAEWCRHEETRDWVRALAEESRALQGEDDPMPLSDQFAALAAVALGRLLKEAVDNAPEDTRGRRALLDTAHALNELRVRDHAAVRLRMDCRRWEAEAHVLDEQERRRQRYAPIKAWLDAVEIRGLEDSVLSGLSEEQQASVRKILGVGAGLN